MQSDLEEEQDFKLANKKLTNTLLEITSHWSTGKTDKENYRRKENIDDGKQTICKRRKAIPNKKIEYAE